MVEFERKKPLGITVCMVFLGFIGFFGCLTSVGMLASLLGDGPFTVNGEVVDRARFAEFLIPFLSFYLSTCLIAAAAAWSIWRGLPQSRPLLLAYSCVFLPMPLLFLSFGFPVSDALTPLVPGVVLPMLAWLYLYRKDSVVQYYTAIRMEREPFVDPDFT